VVARRQAGTLPCPEYAGLTGASCNDGKVFEQIRPLLKNNDLYADKAYQLSDAKIAEFVQGLRVLTLIKKEKGQDYLEPSDQWLSTAVSRVRQPIESLFSWLEEKTGIECASRCALIRGSWFTFSGGLPLPCFFGIFYGLALNAHTKYQLSTQNLTLILCAG
jgi:hypothetical protein